MKIKDTKYIKIINGKAVMVEMPSYSEWLKMESLPRDEISRKVYNQDVKERPRITEVVNLLMNLNIESAKEMLDKLIENIPKEMRP